MDRAHEGAESDHDEEHDRPGELEVDEEVEEDDAEEREHRADREIDAAGDDDDAETERQQPEQADLVREVDEVDRRDELRVDEGGDGAGNEDEEEEAEFFSTHSRALFPLASPRRRGA